MNRETIESFLLRMELDFEEVEPGMWMVRSDQGVRIVAHLSPPVLMLRSTVLEAPPEGEGEPLFRKLLELNASDLVRGAYGLDGDEVILTDALDIESLDYDELQSAVDSMHMALSSHHEVLSPFRPARTESQSEGAR